MIVIPMDQVKLPLQPIQKFVGLLSAAVGQIALITYNYTENEPDPSELSDFLPYELRLSELLAFPDEKRHQITGYVGEVKSSISGRF